MLLSLFYAFLPIIFWGSSFIGTKILLKNGFSPMFISFIRFLIVTIIIFFIDRKNKLSFMINDIKYFFIMGIFGVTLFYFFENTGLKYTTIANTSLITATIPLFTLLYARFFLGKKLLWQNILGIPLSILGTILLFLKDIKHSTLHLKGDFYIFISVFLWIAYSFSYEKLSHKYSQLTILKYIFLIGTISIFPFVINDIKTFNFDKLCLSSILSFLYLSLICTLLSYYLWNKGIKELGIKLTSNLILFIPIISIISGILFWNEKFSLNILFASILIISGSYFTSKRNTGYEF